MPLPKSNSYTRDYIYSLKEGQRAELINGAIYDMAPPNRLHQKIQQVLSWSIETYIRKNNGTCEVYPAPFAVFLNADNKTYVEPDISVIFDKSKLDDRGCNGAPDWIVDIEKQFTTIYRYEEDAAPTIVPFQQEITVGIDRNLSINLSELLK